MNQLSALLLFCISKWQLLDTFSRESPMVQGDNFSQLNYISCIYKENDCKQYAIFNFNLLVRSLAMLRFNHFFLVSYLSTKVITYKPRREVSSVEQYTIDCEYLAYLNLIFFKFFSHLHFTYATFQWGRSNVFLFLNHIFFAPKNMKKTTLKSCT